MPQEKVIEDFFTSAAGAKADSAADGKTPADEAGRKNKAGKSGAAPAPPKDLLPPISNTAAAVLDTGAFFANSAEELRQHKSTRAAHQRLGRKPGELALTIFGEFVNSRDAAQVRRAACHTYLLLRQGSLKEAASQFKTIPDDLQEEIFFTLLDAESGYDLRSIRAALGQLARGARISAELKAKAAEILKDGRQGYLAELTANLRGSLRAVAEQLDNIALPSAKPVFKKMEKDLYRLKDAALRAAYAELEERFAAFSSLLAENQKLFLARQIGLKELAFYLDAAALALDNVCDSFYARLDAFNETRTAASSAARLDAFNETRTAASTGKSGAADFSLLKDAVLAEQAKRYSALAALLRREYEQSGGTLVLKLKSDAYFLVNAALSGLNAVPLSVLFCDLEAEAAPLNTPADLNFLDGCYEYSRQYKSGTAIAFDVIVRLIRQDAWTVSQWDKTKIDELRKLAEFCVQAKAALQDFARKLENIKEIKKMDITLLLFNAAARFLQDMGKALQSLNKTAAVQEVLAQRRFLLEDTRWLQNISLLCQYAG
ncbi:hypothetical protein NO1_0969 [Candidatus Termititenax aidoneus]|uniref:Uncharacterized protein n=1 Tax=Termititenax aidoneus TaxID=2218524 RepID=A0A388TAG6_TERA1|nr:hypothetical protein NO1_0969 [Candidatus Termititenax aidoneus]